MISEKSSYWKLLKTSTMLLCVSSCIEKYEAPVSNENSTLLVVDGFITTSSQLASVKLSHALSLSASQNFPAVANAKVSIESHLGAMIELYEKENGTYEATSPAFKASEEYRLIIKLDNGEKYESQYITPLISPPLDSVSWRPGKDGVIIYANTHDDTNQTRYYKWLYTETWSYYSRYYSFFKLVAGAPVFRDPDEQIYYCWGTEKSSTILVTSTVRLDKDVVSEFPLTLVPKGSRKISKIYSILVEQRAISKAAYDYWTQLEKTTENLGGLFDPLPSQVTGNIYNVDNTAQPVLGYFSAGSVQQKRIYIDFNELPPHLAVNEYGKNCEVIQVPVEKLKELPGDKLLLEPYGSFVIIGYTASTKECVDCTVFGGTTTKPDFWPW